MKTENTGMTSVPANTATQGQSLEDNGLVTRSSITYAPVKN